jgi:hypothetical protein
MIFIEYFDFFIVFFMPRVITPGHISFNDFIIDQSGNNILVDGILKPQNIIRIDITNSQSGSANGQFGYFADYFLITYNEPL